MSKETVATQKSQMCAKSVNIEKLHLFSTTYLTAWILAQVLLCFHTKRIRGWLMDGGTQNAFNAAVVYQRHDLMVELGQLEMAMEHLALRSEQERSQLRPRLESRLARLRDELHHLSD